MSELKKCPFCGSEAEKMGPFYNRIGEYYLVRCSELIDCEVSTVNMSQEEWNNRPEEAKLKAENEELRKGRGIACLKHDLTHNIGCGVCLMYAEAENDRLRAGIKRLASCEAFGATSSAVSEECRLRMFYAEDLLI